MAENLWFRPRHGTLECSWGLVLTTGLDISPKQSFGYRAHQSVLWSDHESPHLILPDQQGIPLMLVTRRTRRAWGCNVGFRGQAENSAKPWALYTKPKPPKPLNPKLGVHAAYILIERPSNPQRPPVAHSRTPPKTEA